jgi:hypothetical protein
MHSDYRQAQLILLNLRKVAQQEQLDPELSSPEVKIEPADAEIQKAIALLKSINPSYFVGVRKIVVDAGGGAYGFVESGQNKDPAVIHINLAKIRNELKSKLPAATKEQFEKELVRQIATTVSHERGHIKSFKPETGFEGGESPAESEERQMLSRIDANPNR